MSNLKSVTVNAKQKLYVIPAGEGYTCLGFDVAQRRTLDLIDWLSEVEVDAEIDSKDVSSLHGTIEGYNLYKNISALAIKTARNRRSIVPTELCKQLIPYENQRVEVIDCYGEKRRFWVGKSTGPIPVHLEIKRRNSLGGEAVMCTPFQSVRRVA